MQEDKHKNQDSADAGDPLIRTVELTKKFGENVVLDNVSLAIGRGKCTVVIGQSGCGKTVLIKHFLGLLRPTSGQVYFKDTRIDNLSEDKLSGIRTHFGFLFQEGALFDSLTVAENILFPVRRHYKITGKSGIDELVKSKLAVVGLQGYENQFPENLSGGQKKRVALARAIALNPEVILYDEPTTGLDPVRADMINELICKLQNNLGITSIVVTHDMKSAYKIANRIVMLHNGKILADGDTAHIRSHRHPDVQHFIHGKVSRDELSVLQTDENLNNSTSAKEPELRQSNTKFRFFRHSD